MRKEALSRKVFTFYIPLAALLVFSVFPFIWTFITSLKSNNELFTPVFRYLPHHPTIQNYIDLMQQSDFPSNMRNSLIVASATSVISLCVSLLAAYAFSRYKFKGKYVVMVSFLSINLFPSTLTLIPLYQIMSKIHLLNTPFALMIAYSTFTIPFSVWLLTGYLNDLPISLEEAAMVDGCNRRQAFLRIILPLTIPGVIATGIYIFINAWNDFIFAVMFTNTASRTLPVALQAFVGEFDIQWGMLTAGGVVTIIPIVILFSIIQKQLIQGLTAGAVKG
jgi:multiple sugar transport system permease protein